MSWLHGTSADTRDKPLTQTQKDRRKRKACQKRKKNAITQAKLKGKPIGRAIRAFELREVHKERSRKF